MAISGRRKAIADASMAATRLHLQLKTPFDRPVDVVTLAQQLGVWVAAQPLDALYGFYLREQTGSCIVLNSKHPETLQRFTCGHEIGHHVLGHESLTDVRETVTAIEQPHLDLKEVAAQSFAASLLMPLPLVNAVLRAFVDDRTLTPSDVYVVSRELGVSYAAAVTQLQQLNKITRDEGQLLARRRPLAVKSELRGGREQISDARADVWLLSEGQNGAVLQCRVGDEIHVQLAEDLSRGLRWEVAGKPSRAPVSAGTTMMWSGEDTLHVAESSARDFAYPDGLGRVEDIPDDSAAGLTVVVDEHVNELRANTEIGVAEPRDAPAGIANDTAWPELPEPGVRLVVLFAEQPGRQTLRMQLTEPWLADRAPAAVFTVTLNVAPRRRLEGSGVAQPQRDAYVRRLTAA